MRLLSTCNPSSLCVSTDVTVPLSVCTENAALALRSFCLVPNSMHSVFSAFNTMRLASIQMYSGFDFVVSDRFTSPTHLPAVIALNRRHTYQSACQIFQEGCRGNTLMMCEFHYSNCNGFAYIWWTDKLFYFSNIDRLVYIFVNVCLCTCMCMCVSV